MMAATMKFRIYCAMSLDGFIADESGSVRWFEPYQSADYGYNTFLASVRTVVTGPKSYESARGFGPWEYAGKQSIVLTSQSSVPALVADLRRHARGDVWIMGGAQVMGAFLDAGAVDSMELYIVPVLLGRGVALFSREGQPLEAKLLETHRFANGVVRVRYEPATG